MKKKPMKTGVIFLLLFLCLCFGISRTSAIATPGKDYDELDVSQAEQADLCYDDFPSFTREDHASGFQDYADESATLMLPNGQTGEEAPSNAVGTVFDQDTQQPVSNAVLTVIHSETEDTVTVTTDETGRFQITGLPDGYYFWNLSHPDHRDASYRYYEVCAGAGTYIYTFYMSADSPISETSYNYLKFHGADDA